MHRLRAEYLRVLMWLSRRSISAAVSVFACAIPLKINPSVKSAKCSHSAIADVVSVQR